MSDKFESLNISDDDGNKEIDIITLLLIGSTGAGKSTLANVISNSNDFETSSGSVSLTKSINSHNYTIGDQIYKIVDTVGIGDTKIPPKETIIELALAAETIKCGINQILFVVNGKFTEIEIEAFETLQSVVFDKSVFEYTTIVRTNFSDFEDDDKCSKDYRDMISETDQLTQFVNSCKKVIHVDNPPITGRYEQVGKVCRKESRTKLLKHLSTCTNVYMPENLRESLNAGVKNYMTKKEKLEKLVKELEEKIKKLEEKDKKSCIIV